MATVVYVVIGAIAGKLACDARKNPSKLNPFSWICAVPGIWNNWEGVHEVMEGVPLAEHTTVDLSKLEAGDGKSVLTPRDLAIQALQTQSCPQHLINSFPTEEPTDGWWNEVIRTAGRAQLENYRAAGYQV